MASLCLRVKQRGGTGKEVEKAVEHQTNVNALGHRIVFNNTHSILKQALLQKFDILDCLTVVDLRHAPPIVQLQLASVFLSDDTDKVYRVDVEAMNHYLKQNRQDGCLSVWVRAFASADREGVLLTTCPGMSAPLGSWSAAQADMKRTIDDELKYLHRYPDELERRLCDLQLVKSMFGKCQAL